MRGVTIKQLILFVAAGFAVLVAGIGFYYELEFIAVIIAVLLAVAGYILYKRQKQDEETVVEIANQILAGDFEGIGEKHYNTAISTTLETLLNLAEHYEKQILTTVVEAHRLESVYNEMQIIIDDFLYKAQTMKEASGTIASATEELSANSQGVSSSTEQASEKIEIISSNTEEMTATINEISSNSEKARYIAQNAVNSVEQATHRVSELSNNTIEISKIIDVIEEISDQTKLLALNATIEAARAGEAGKGFAVVANEVKELAGQTSEATENIKKSIFTIQASSKEASGEIGKISHVIADVEENISSIATAVEEQNVTTHDIAGNITQVAKGIKDVSFNITQSTDATRLIAEDMVKISAASGQILDDGININSQIKNISAISSKLNNLSSLFRFNKEIRHKIDQTVELAQLLQEREADHLKWVKKVQNSVVEHRNRIDVQKDPALCGMGKYLNSKQRKEAEKRNPKLARIYHEMEEPHNKLHQSARHLEEMLQNPDIPNSEIENYYSANTVQYLNQLLHLFHEAIAENFNSLKI